MLRSEFLELIIENIEPEVAVNETSILADIEEWDSLAAVTTLALFKKHLGLNIAAENLKTCKTLRDVLNLGSEKFN